MLALQASSLYAEDVVDADAIGEEDVISESRWYQVEVMIYRQMSMSGDIAEVWPTNITLNYPDNWVLLQTPDQYFASTGKKAVINTPYILLDKKLPVFTQLEKKLVLNRNEILFHGSWRQLLKQGKNPDEDINPSILVRGGRNFDTHYELEGSISLRLSRYLHIKTNLWLSHFIPLPPSPSTNDAEGEQVPAGIVWPTLPSYPVVAEQVTDPAITPPADQYQVDEIVWHQQSRRMRSYELHYLDHPKIGIVVQLIPLDENTMLPIPKKK